MVYRGKEGQRGKEGRKAGEKGKKGGPGMVLLSVQQQQCLLRFNGHDDAQVLHTRSITPARSCDDGRGGWGDGGGRGEVKDTE